MSNQRENRAGAHKTCDRCQYPCVNNGENLKPITIDELRKMGYILCEEYTEDFD